MRGDMRCAQEAAGAMIRYIHYLNTRIDAQGLMNIGLGDWCPAYRNKEAPRIVTDSIISYDIALKAAYLYKQMNMPLEESFCKGFAINMRKSIRNFLVEDWEKMLIKGSHQTCQAMFLYYDLCDTRDEIFATLETLIAMIRECDDHMGVGVLGGRVLFRVLCDYGYEDLAIKMITRTDEPSYGWMVTMGLTTLSETVTDTASSYNHHFWGDISALMIEYFAGIRINPELKGADTVAIAPVFPRSLDHASAYHVSVCGRINVKWEKTGDGNILLDIVIPEKMNAIIIPPVGYLVNGESEVTATTGQYIITKNN
jgi:alpha-L-rhamnosidase